MVVAVALLLLTTGRLLRFGFRQASYLRRKYFYGLCIRSLAVMY